MISTVHGNSGVFAGLNCYNLVVINMKIYFFSLTLVLLICRGIDAAPQGFPLADRDSVLGSVMTYKIGAGESLIETARKYDLGYNQIVTANSGLDPYVPDALRLVVIPTSWILPEGSFHSGIVINLSEFRLYLFYRVGHSRGVFTFPIGIGSEGKNTPTGHFVIIEKIIRPPWYVPESIRKENPNLPAVVPPGPENPLGSHAMRLSLPSILIHGTNRPLGIGRRVSHGCLHLYPEDITVLFHLVKKGMNVTIVRQPVKVGLKGGKVYLEVHGEDAKNDSALISDALSLLAKKSILGRVSTEKLYSAIRDKKGMPVDISE